jgi:hypothetical protein
MYRACRYASGARHLELFDFAAPASISSAVISGFSFAETLPDDGILPAAASTDGH